MDLAKDGISWIIYHRTEINVTKVLIVDDSAFMRAMIKNIVKQKNCETIEASNADESVEKYKAEKPDIVFMDIIMDGRTGLDALRDIKAYNGQAIVIMCTSIIGQDHVVKEAIDSGAVDFILKPFKAGDILKVIEKYGK